MGQFNPLAGGGKDDRMVPDYIAAPEGVDADFGGCSGAGDADSTVPQFLLKLDLPNFAEDFEERGGSSAGSVAL